MITNAGKTLFVTSTIVLLKSSLFRCMAIVVVTAMAFLGQGCSHRFTTRAYLPDTPKWHSEDEGVGTSLYGPDLEIFVRVSPLSGPEAQVNTLAISLYFHLQRTDFEFNPNKSVLHVTSVGGVKPSRYRIVFAGPQSRVASWDCGRYPSINLRPDSIYGLHRGICVELYFDASPKRLDQFWLKLDGLTQNGRKVDVPEIRFREGRAWVWEFL